MIKWWGYKHVSGSLQAKRYFDKEDLIEAKESPFVAQIVQPFEAKDRAEALLIIKTKTE
jgi:hypothetical protein